MDVEPKQRLPMARLFSFLAAAETMARDCARRQSRLAEGAPARRFFASQARHEAVHAAVFAQAALWLGPKNMRVGAVSRMPSLERYREHLMAAAARDDLLDTVIGQQVVFEGLGEVTLRRIDAGIRQRGLGFDRARRMILAQERAHHGFGQRWLDERLRREPRQMVRLRATAAVYVELLDDVLSEVTELFVPFDEDPALYRSELARSMPVYLRDLCPWAEPRDEWRAA